MIVCKYRSFVDFFGGFITEYPLSGKAGIVAEISKNGECIWRYPAIKLFIEL